MSLNSVTSGKLKIYSLNLLSYKICQVKFIEGFCVCVRACAHPNSNVAEGEIMLLFLKSFFCCMM
jgi:hypothetical protein